MNLLELLLHQVKVIQQPYSSGRNVLAALRDGGNVVVGLAQCGNVVLNTREERQAFAPTAAGAHRLCLSQAAAMFFKTLRAEQLGTYQRFCTVWIAGEYFPGVSAQGFQAVECGSFHMVKRCQPTPAGQR